MNHLDIAKAKEVLKGVEGNKEHAFFVCDLIIKDIVTRVALQRKWLRIRKIIAKM